MVIQSDLEDVVGQRQSGQWPVYRNTLRKQVAGVIGGAPSRIGGVHLCILIGAVVKIVGCRAITDFADPSV